MKIEVCEQMLASWLQHIKGCQIVQTNWNPSPLVEIPDVVIESVSAFVAAVKDYLGDDDIDIFKKSTIRQMVLQCEIDIVGIRIVDGGVGDLYLIDSAFHENGLNYNKVIATVMKKILRAALVSSIVFPGVPANVVFVSPKCGQTLQKQLTDTLSGIDTVTKQFYPDTSVLMLFNEEFAETVYRPLLEQVDKINNDNDLFIRSMKLSQVALSFDTRMHIDTPPQSYQHKVVIGERTSRGENRDTVFAALGKLIRDGYMTPELLKQLCSKEFCRSNFQLSSFPFLVKNSEFPATGYQDCRFYSDRLVTIMGDEYRVCSQWIPERIRRLQYWLQQIETTRR